MKENLKIRVNDDNRQEIIDLLGKLGKSFCWDVKTRWSEIVVIFAYKKQNLEWDSDLGYNYFKGHSNKEITLPELRELARPKEYLNDKFELVVTNQPEDGFILVPDGANFGCKSNKSENIIFWQKADDSTCYSTSPNDQRWSEGQYCFNDYVRHNKIPKTWQRENKVETIGEEAKRLANESVDRIIAAKSKGRFLHQWAYEAFGRGEDVQHTPCERDCDWTSTSIASPISIFSAREMKFRLKPQTIQIGSRTIVKPISVKPEMGTVVYVSSATQDEKYISISWDNSLFHLSWLNRNLCYLTAVDAIAMTDALLEFMK